MKIAGHNLQLVQDEEIDKVDFFLEKINTDMTRALNKFNMIRTKLYDVSRFFLNLKNARNEPPVDKIAYLSTLGECRWSGPYKELSLDWYYFVAINDSGDNDYYVRLEV